MRLGCANSPPRRAGSRNLPPVFYLVSVHIHRLELERCWLRKSESTAFEARLSLTLRSPHLVVYLLSFCWHDVACAAKVNYEMALCCR